jgi:uncharacterized protein YjbI with pentapeptide repeats
MEGYMHDRRLSADVRPDGYQPPTSVEELLARYAIGKRYFEETDLPDGSSLVGATLAGANLRRSFMFNADFSGADLRGAIIESCNIKCGRFRDANLEGSSLRHCAVESTEWDGANLEGVSFEGCTAYGYRFKEGERP